MHTFTNKSRPQLLKQISLRKSFYTNTQDNLIHAIQYLEDHPDIGHINHIILECFRTLYAPLGLLENSEPTEARRVALQSIATLEAHITFLREEFDIAKPVPAQVMAPPTTIVQSQPQLKDARKEKPELSEDAATVVDPYEGFALSPEEREAAINLFEAFNQE